MYYHHCLFRSYYLALEEQKAAREKEKMETGNISIVLT